MSAPFRVLFLCTGNSARSQIAQALLTHLGGDRFEAASVGTASAPRVNPGALDVSRGTDLGPLGDGRPGGSGGALSPAPAFADTLRVLRVRIGELVGLPVDELPRGELESRIRALERPT